MKIRLISAVILSFFAVSVWAQNKASDIVGVWLTEEVDCKVKIYEKNGKYVGKIIWLDEPLNEEGKPKIDENNPNEMLRKRKIMGLHILTGLVFDGDDTWKQGKCYDPEEGNTYDGKCWMEGKNILHLRGYIGISLIGRTSKWTRVE